MKRLTAFALATLCAALPPVAATAESRTLELPAFHAVDVSSGIRADVTAGPDQSVVIESNSKADLDDLRVDVRDGTLYFWYDWSIGNLFSALDRNLTVTLTAPVIDDLGASAGAFIGASALKADALDFEASAGARIEALDTAAKSYDAEASAGASIELAGTCTDADYEVSSGASINASKLDCADAEFDVSSGASLQLTAHETIDGDVSSGGSATIYGKPEVRQLDTSSGGSISFRD